MITHRERLQACLRGERTDRAPVALWRHFPVDDQQPESLAAATLYFQQTYDFDLVKVTPASSFCLKDWGVQDQWRGNTEGTRDYTQRIIIDPRDWERLPVLEPGSPSLAAQLQSLALIRTGLTDDVPVIQTIFNPLAQARNLAGADRLLAHLRLFPESVLKGLETIAETTRRFTEAALETGIDGIFYAIQHAQASLLSLDEYRRFGFPFDRQVLVPAQDAWCNMLHLHGHAVYFELATEGPFHILNWHDRESAPSLAQAASQSKRTLCGGLRQDTLVYGDATQVGDEVADALEQTGGRNFILSTGCVVPVIAPHGNLLAARRKVESFFASGSSTGAGS